MGEETKIIRIIVDSSKAVDGSAAATKALQALEQQSGNMDATLSRIEKSIASVGATVKANLILALTELGLRLKQMASDSLKAVAGLDDLAESAGVTTKFLQGIQFAAASNTVPLDALQDGMTKFAQKMGEAAAGSKPVIDSLTSLGVKNLDLQGKLRPTEALMRDVAIAILAMDDPAKRVSASVDFFGRSGAKLIPMLKDIAAGAEVMGGAAARAGTMIDDSVIKSLQKMESQSEQSALKFRALFATIGAPIITSALESVNNLLAQILGNLERLKKMEREKDVTANKVDASNLDDQIAAQRGLLAINPRNTMAQSSLNALVARRDAATARATIAAQVLMQQDEDSARAGKLPMAEAPGAGTSVSTEAAAAAQSMAERIKKETDALKAAAAAQEDMTKAARAGDTAFQDQQAHAEALTKAIDIYGGKVSDADPKVKALTASLEALIKRTKEGAAAQAFVVATTELQKQNVLLEAQNRLINEAPEVQAREIALIKSKQEAEKAGNALTAEDVENRRAAIEANERLKIQAGELKAAQELWTEPLKQALRNIQSAGADAFEQMLTTGTITFQSLSDTFSKIVRRMAAEFLALATIRPVMSIMVQSLSSGGIISPNAAAQMGFPQGGSVTGSAGGNVSSGGGGGLSFGMPSGGGGGFFSSIWDGSAFQGAVPSQAGVYGPQMPGALNSASGLQMGNFGFGNAMGAVGIGMGALSLANAKTTGQTIGGVGQMVGGALMMIPTPWTMAAGAIISLASSILPGLLGGGQQEPPMRPLNYSTGFFRFNNSTGRPFTGDMGNLNGGSSLSGMSEAAQSVLGLIYSAGGTPVAGKLYGGGLGMGIRDPRQGDKPYFNVDLVNPDGSGTRIADDLASPFQNVMEFLISKIFKADVLNGGVKGASPALATALTTKDPNTLADTKALVDFVNVYDKLGKAANPVKDALTKLNLTLIQMKQSAEEYGLSLEPINEQFKKETKRTAQDFIDNMLDPLAVQMRALDDERESALASAQYIKDNVTDVYVDMDKIAVYYTNKRAALENQYYQGAVDNLKNLIARLTYGDLANASPDTSLSGTRAAYNANLAQARAGDSSAIANLSGYAESYVNSARSYFASGPEYAALIAQIRQDLAEQVAGFGGGGSTGTKAANDTANALASNYSMLADMFAKSQNDNAELRNQLTVLIAQLARKA